MHKTVATLLCLALPLAFAPAAHAAGPDPAQGTVKTKGVPLKIRKTPSTSAGIVGSAANGSKISISCQANGDVVTGTFGTSSLWDKVGAGYVSDAYVLTGSDDPVAPPCKGTTTPPSSGGGGITDDYPYRADSPNGVDPWSFYKRECVSFVAWRLTKRHGKAFTNHYKGAHWGNAKTWDEAARATGVQVDHTPSVGAVAQWNRGSFGHVAYVARVAATTVTLEEYNRGGTHRYATRTIGRTDVENYIHVA